MSLSSGRKTGVTFRSPIADRGISGADRLQQIAVGDEGDALPPWPIARREMRVDLVIGTEITAYAGQQLALHLVRFGEGTLRKHGLIVQDLAAHDLVDPGLVDLQLAQFVGKLDRVAAGAVPGR